MANFQVPQYIDTEDKIVGPLTLRQFLYLAVAFLISFSFFYILQIWLWLIITVFLGAFVAALAFVKVGGKSFAGVVVSAFKFYWSPRMFFWRHEIPAPLKISDKISSIKIPSLGKLKSKKEKIVIPQLEIKKPQITITKKPAIQESTLTTGSGLKSLAEKMMTTKNVITQREKPFSLFGRRHKQKYSVLEKFTGERVSAKRVDYR